MHDILTKILLFWFLFWGSILLSLVLFILNLTGIITINL